MKPNLLPTPCPTMARHLRPWWAVAIMMLPFLAIPARGAVEGDFEFTVAGGQATLTGYLGSGGSVVIPGLLGGQSMTSIGDYAFRYQTRLTSVTIPDSVTEIGRGAFYGCTGLTSIDVDALNPAYNSEEGVLFDLARSVLLVYPAGRAGAYTIPDLQIL